MKIKIHTGYDEELSQHVERIREYCRMFAEKMPQYVDMQLLDSAAYYHDIAKSEYGDEHHKSKNVQRSMMRRGMLSLPDEALDIIEAHKGKFKPPDEVAVEAAILRSVDKFDRYNKGKDDARKKCRASLRKIKERFLEMDLDQEWAAFKRAYWEMHKEVVPRSFLYFVDRIIRI